MTLFFILLFHVCPCCHFILPSRPVARLCARALTEVANFDHNRVVFFASPAAIRAGSAEFWTDARWLYVRTLVHPIFSQVGPRWPSFLDCV